VSTPGTSCPPAIARGVGCVVREFTEGAVTGWWEHDITHIARLAEGELTLSPAAWDLTGTWAVKDKKMNSIQCLELGQGQSNSLSAAQNTQEDISAQNYLVKV
jgi:hypothetical protein